MFRLHVWQNKKQTQQTVQSDSTCCSVFSVVECFFLFSAFIVTLPTKDTLTSATKKTAVQTGYWVIELTVAVFMHSSPDRVFSLLEEVTVS